MNRICPSCGSRNIAKIFYGYPMMDRELRRKMDNDEIKLGGCIITDNSPKYFCNDCEIEFDTDTTLIGGSVNKIFFRIGYWNSPEEYTFSKDKLGNIIFDDFSQSMSHFDKEKILWDIFIKEILSCHVLDWQDTYMDESIIDGIQWTLKLVLADGETIEKGGSNAYPPHFKKFKSIFEKVKKSNGFT